MNVGIHLLCIWNLVWSGMALQHMLGVFAPAPTSMATLPLVGGVPLTLATITTAIYVVSYVMMDPVAGGLGALLMLVLNQVFNQSHFIIPIFSTSGHTSWWQREPLWQDCLFGKQFLPSMLPPGLHRFHFLLFLLQLCLWLSNQECLHHPLILVHWSRRL